jgi:hypothetical protein
MGLQVRYQEGEEIMGARYQSLKKKAQTFKSEKVYASKGSVWSVKADPEKVRAKYASIEKKPKGEAKKELNAMLEGKGLSTYGQGTVKGKINALVRAESETWKARNSKGQVTSWMTRSAAQKAASNGKSSETSTERTKPDTKEFQKAAGSKATVGLDIVKPRTRAQKATEIPVVTKTTPVTSDDKIPRAEVTAVEKLPQFKVDKGTGKLTPAESETTQERSRDVTRGHRGQREKKGKNGWWARRVPYSRARRRMKVKKREKKLERAERDEALSEREENIQISKTRRRAELAEAKARKRQATQFSRGYI